MKKYRVKMTVEHDFDVEDLTGITQEDIEIYKEGFQDVYLNGEENIEDVKGLILSELENAIFSNLPVTTPYTSEVLKIRSDMKVIDAEIEGVGLEE